MNVATLERSPGSTGQALLSRALARFAPPPLLTVSQFADREIVVTSGPLSGTHWQTDFAPYQRGILDAFHEPGVQVVVVMGSQPVGQDGLRGQHRRLPHGATTRARILVVEPTVDPMAKDFARNRLEPVIAASPVAQRRRQQEAREGLEQHHPDEDLPRRVGVDRRGELGGIAGGPGRARFWCSMKSTAIRPELPGEGNTLAIAMKRTTPIGRRRRVLMLSSPTLRDGPIDAWFQRGDQRRF